MRRNFTLIELLIVVAIIAILAGMLLPALNKARENAKKIKCVGNQKQVALACTLYGNDNEGCLPPHNGGSFEAGSKHTSALPRLSGYLGGPDCGTVLTSSFNDKKIPNILFCTSKQVDRSAWGSGLYSYGFSGSYTGTKAYAYFKKTTVPLGDTDIKIPVGKCVMVADVNCKSFDVPNNLIYSNEGFARSGHPYFIHNNSAAMSMFDGSAKAVTVSDFLSGGKSDKAPFFLVYEGKASPFDIYYNEAKVELQTGKLQ